MPPNPASPPKPLPTPDFQAIFNAAPSPLLWLDRQWQVRAVNDAYVQATGLSRDQMLGPSLFDWLDDDPQRPHDQGAADMRQSLTRAWDRAKPDALAGRWYSLRHPQQGRILRYWSVVHVPLPDEIGQPIGVLQRIHDLTDVVQPPPGDAPPEDHDPAGDPPSRPAAGLDLCPDQMLAEMYLRAQQLELANRELRSANEALAHREAELARTAEALRRSEERLRLAQQCAGVGAWDWDLASDQLTWSPALYELLGADPETTPATYESWLACVHPDDRPQADRAVRAVAAGQGELAIEFRVLHPDHGTRWISSRGRTITDAHGQAVRMVGIAMDVTGRKRDEENRARLAAIVHSSGDAIISFTRDGMIQTWNPAAQRIFGYEPDEAIGRPGGILIPPDCRDQAEAMFDQARAGQAVLNVETQRLRRDGSRVTVDLSLTPIHGPHGQVTGICAVFRDVSERKQAAEALQASEERFRLAAQLASDLIYEWDLNSGRVTWYGDIDRLLGYAPKAFPRTHDGRLEAVHDEDRDRLVAAIQRSLQTGQPCSEEYRIRRSNGSVRYRVDRGVILCDGRDQRWLGVITDVTDRKLVELQLKALSETLEHRVAERTAVAERPADQLRRLTSDLTQTEQRERRRLAQTLHDHLQQLLVAAKLRMGVLFGGIEDDELRDALRQVEDLLNQSIDASRSLTVELSPPILYDVGLAPALHWLARWEQEKHGLTVEVEADEAAEPEAEDVRAMLFAAVRELLFNVVKHAQVDRARVTMRREGEQVVIEVNDEGVGFDPAQAAAREAAAEGFGLFSIEERMELMGGELTVQSTPGAGCRTTLKAPLRPTCVATAATHEPAAQRPHAAQARQRKTPPAAEDVTRVLLADDHRILREGLAGLLTEQPDIDVVAEASDGEEAVALAHHTRPDVVVMDVTMPRLNGVEATRRITRELPGVKVIGLSMHEEEDMAAAMTDAGAAAYLPKGGPCEKLVAAIRACTAERASAAT